MATPNSSGKTMSSRLLTMKFMQRSATSSSTPSTPTEPPTKRQRLSFRSSQPSPATPPNTEALAVQQALVDEEQKRSAAIEREAADKGETKWYFNYKEPITPARESPLRFVTVGYGALDNDTAGSDSEEDLSDRIRPQITGRKSFGRFNKRLEKQQNPNAPPSTDSEDSSSSEEEDAGEEDDLSDDPTGAKAMITEARQEAGSRARAERKAKKKADKVEAARLAEERRNKQVNLNKLSSISGFGSTSHAQNVTCHKCGLQGHLQRDCPQGASSRRRGR